MSFRVKIWKFLFIVLCRKSWKLLKGLKIPFLKSSIFGEGGGGVERWTYWIFLRGLAHEFESKKFRIDLLSYK